MIIDEAVLITVDQDPPKVAQSEPLVDMDGSKLYDPKPQEIQLSSPVPQSALPLATQPEAQSEPRKVLRPWYEMIDRR